jgi:hypothetical protein
LTKAEDQQMAMQNELLRLERVMATPGYKKTKADIQAEHHHKVTTNKASLLKLKESIGLFLSLMTKDQIAAYQTSRVSLCWGLFFVCICACVCVNNNS